MHTMAMADKVNIVKLDDQADRNHCAVNAFATAMDIPYWQASALFTWAGREHGHGTNRSITTRLLAEFGFRWLEAGPVVRWIPGSRVVRRFATFAQVTKWAGTFYCFSAHHAACIKNGCLYDTWDTSRRRLVEIWTLIPQSPLPVPMLPMPEATLKPPEPIAQTPNPVNLPLRPLSRRKRAAIRAYAEVQTRFVQHPAIFNAGTMSSSHHSIGCGWVRNFNIRTFRKLNGLQIA